MIADCREGLVDECKPHAVRFRDRRVYRINLGARGGKRFAGHHAARLDKRIAEAPLSAIGLDRVDERPKMRRLERIRRFNRDDPACAGSRDTCV